MCIILSRVTWASGGGKCITLLSVSVCWVKHVPEVTVEGKRKFLNFLNCATCNRGKFFLYWLLSCWQDHFWISIKACDLAMGQATNTLLLTKKSRSTFKAKFFFLFLWTNQTMCLEHQNMYIFIYLIVIIIFYLFFLWQGSSNWKKCVSLSLDYT